MVHKVTTLATRSNAIISAGLNFSALLIEFACRSGAALEAALRETGSPSPVAGNA